MDLKCRKTTCKHNNKYACMAKEIMVDKKTTCDTFEKAPNKREEKLQDVSKTMFESAPDLHPYRHNKECKINCNAECLFNNKGLCQANGITMLSGTNDGVCGTFIEK